MDFARHPLFAMRPFTAIHERGFINQARNMNTETDLFRNFPKEESQQARLEVSTWISSQTGLHGTRAIAQFGARLELVSELIVFA